MTSSENQEVEEITIGTAHRAMKSGDLTARGLVEAYLKWIARVDGEGPKLNAVVTINDAALEEADRLDTHLSGEGGLAGPLHGIPILVKDCIETEQVVTSFGSEVFADYLPEQDAVTVRKLREAGAIILGKTSLPDFATSWFSFSSRTGDTRNPYNLDHDPGGSSAGTGAAIAANFATVGIGTDCGGSIRLPSSFCNLVGFRSTPGVVPRTGSSYLVIFQDTIGPMTRTVEDAARVFEVLAGYDESDPYTAAYLTARAPARYTEALDPDGLKDARVGLVVNAMGPDDEPASAAVNQVVRASVETIQDAGGEVVEVEIDDLVGHYERTSQYVARTKHDINAFLSERPAAQGMTLNRIVEEGRYHRELDLIDAVMEGPEQPEDDPDYFRRIGAREDFARAAINVMGKNNLDVLSFPTAQVPAPSMEDRKKWDTLTFPTNTLIASQTWMPSITVPAGFTESGLPVGMEFVTLPYDEPSAFKYGYAFEQAANARRAPRLNDQ